jgi:hypothetical protein
MATLRSVQYAVNVFTITGESSREIKLKAEDLREKLKTAFSGLNQRIKIKNDNESYDRYSFEIWTDLSMVSIVLSVALRIVSEMGIKASLFEEKKEDVGVTGGC